MINTENKIRSFKGEDKAALIELFKLNIPTFFDSNEIIDFENYLTQDPENHFVMEHDIKILGCCGFKIDENKNGHITWIFFHPNAQGLGLGKQIVNYCLDRMNNQNSVENIIVRTSQKAFQFFEKFQFKLEYIKEDFWGKGLDLYYMTKEMPS